MFLHQGVLQFASYLLSSSCSARSVLFAPRCDLSAGHLFLVIQLGPRCSRRHVSYCSSAPNPIRAKLGATVTRLLMLTFSRFSTTCVGGGLIFAQQQQTETQEEFNERMENPGAPSSRLALTDSPGLASYLQGSLFI